MFSHHALLYGLSDFTVFKEYFASQDGGNIMDIIFGAGDGMDGETVKGIELGASVFGGDLQAIIDEMERQKAPPDEVLHS